MSTEARLVKALAARWYGETPLFAAADMAAVFDWARAEGATITNIDPLILGPGFTEPSMKFERYREGFESDDAFAADCLASSQGLMDYAATRGGVAYYEVTLGDECRSN